MHRHLRNFVLVALASVAACRGGFKLQNYKDNTELYKAAVHEYQKHHWENAVNAFEKLTVELSPRDTLLPRSYWYLASAHDRQGEHLLAAQSYSRLVESFPEDTLADNAALESARSYRKLWRKPDLDDTYGQTALAAYGTLTTLYPDSPLIPQAQKEIAQLNDWMARKNFDAGMFYLRRKAWDSSIIYFKDVLERWPDTPTARDAGLKLVDAYKAIRYHEDASDMCTSLRQKYPKDHDVDETCKGIPNATPAAAASVTP